MNRLILIVFILILSGCFNIDKSIRKSIRKDIELNCLNRFWLNICEKDKEKYTVTKLDNNEWSLYSGSYFDGIIYLKYYFLSNGFEKKCLKYAIAKQSINDKSHEIDLIVFNDYLSNLNITSKDEVINTFGMLLSDDSDSYYPINDSLSRICYTNIKKETVAGEIFFTAKYYFQFHGVYKFYFQFEDDIIIKTVRSELIGNTELRL